MGEMIRFASNGGEAEGYLALPGEPGPALIVLQEWWGLVPHIKDVADRFAAEGFVALAPDLYEGESAESPDDAGRMMMTLDIEDAGRALGGAIDHLLAHDDVTSSGVGVVGYCMGGGLALMVAAQRPDAVHAVAPYYGVLVWEDHQPDLSKITAKVQGHYAELDDFVTPAVATDLAEALRSHGADVELFIYEGADHAFFNDTRPDVYNADAATLAWDRTLALFRTLLG
ncbi:MAG: dienelactone hydrolase family protein [Acidimicrobiia bacterium]|nr:dienelactone hydrolase family protein [Acidimicrobiia bacterium]